MCVNFYDLKPQIVESEYGEEPSIRQLLFSYYNTYFLGAKAKELTDEYISKLEEMKRKPFEMVIDGPNSHAHVILKSDLKDWHKSYAEEMIIKGLEILTGDDNDDYTVTILKKD